MQVFSDVCAKTTLSQHFTFMLFPIAKDETLSENALLISIRLHTYDI